MNLLLPSGKVFVASHENYSLYDYSLILHTTNLSDELLYLLPFVWQTAGPKCVSGSSCFLTKHMANIVVGNLSSASTILFDYTSASNKSPLLVELSYLPANLFFRWAYLGYKCIVVMHDHGPMTMISHTQSFATPASGDPFIGLHKCYLSKTYHICHWFPILDEESGRLVYNMDIEEPETGNAQFAVVDFAMIFKQ